MPLNVLDGRVVANKNREKGIQEHEGSAKTGIGDDGEECAEQVDFRHHRKEEHSGNRAGHCKGEKEFLSRVAMISSSRHGDDKQGLDQDAEGKGVHGKACGIDLQPQNMYHASRWFDPTIRSISPR